MILVSGGQLDPNIGALLRRILQRGAEFRDLLVGASIVPELTIDLDRDSITLNGETISPSALFIRYDIFGQQNSSDPTAGVAALNWFYALRGWALSRKDVLCFNRHALSGDGSKIQNLVLARKAGLLTPETIVTNDWGQVAARQGHFIHKPVAGGDYTGLISDLVAAEPERLGRFPRFVQPRLGRPELRVYRIGERLFGFTLHSDALDYRVDTKVRIEPTEVGEIAQPLLRLCDDLGLDFAAADFMQESQIGELIFLEVNAQPMFARFDAAIDGRLCDAIIDHLSSIQE